jgi:ATP-dependent exoDNAse (exonuclease V) beta subunit
MDEKLYYKILQQLDLIRQIYIARGWKLITEPVYLHSELQDAQGNTVRVAGETDMIAVDKDGNYHIIDFKTSYGKFVPVILGSDNNKYAYDRFSEALPTLDRYSVEPRTAKRTYRQQYSN